MVHPNKDPIKKKAQDLKLDGQDGLRLNFKWFELNGEKIRILVTHLDQSMISAGPKQADKATTHKYWISHRLDLNQLNWAQSRPNPTEPASNLVAQILQPDGSMCDARQTHDLWIGQPFGHSP